MKEEEEEEKIEEIYSQIQIELKMIHSTSHKNDLMTKRLSSRKSIDRTCDDHFIVEEIFSLLILHC